MLKGGGNNQDKNLVQKSLQAVYRSIDVITVVLLLSGQINVSGVFFFKGGGFSLSFTGPILGGARSWAATDTPGADGGLDFISLIAALLVILDQINVTGTLFSQGGFTIVLSGPVFGESKRVAYAPEAREFFDAFREHVLNTL